MSQTTKKRESDEMVLSDMEKNEIDLARDEYREAVWMWSHGDFDDATDEYRTLVMDCTRAELESVLNKYGLEF